MGKLIKKVISNRLQFHLSANGFLNSHQFGGIHQWSTIDIGIYFTHLIRIGWLWQCHTSVLAFDITQFFPSLNHQFLSLYLKKASLNTNVIHFFNSYYSDHSISYSWNSFTSPFFNVNISIGQGSTLSPILSALYLAPIIKTFKKKIKNLNKEIPTDILSFVDNRLLISQEKSYSLSNSFLLCSYNIISKILIDASLVMEHNKTEIFHFTRAQHPLNLFIDLTSVGGPIINPKPIWRYLGFFFDWKLNFYYYTHFYATKCLSTLSAMKMLGNSSQGLLPIQKQLLYRTCILPIAMYEFNLWFFKGASIIKNVNELKKIQYKVALWITGTFQISPSDGIEAIAGLIPITLYIRKLNGRHYLRYGSILSSHAINSLLDLQHAKNHPLYKTATSKLTNNQRSNLKSPIKDVNERLNDVRDCYNLLFSLFSPGSRVVDYFSSRFSFYSPLSSSNKDLFYHLQNLDQVFRSSQISPHNIVIIANRGIKKSQVATTVVHIWTNNSIVWHLQVNSINVTSIEAKLMAICLGLILAIKEENIHNIIVITDSIAAAKKIFESKTNPLQNMFILVTLAINSFFRKDNRNKIQFWFCPSKAKWPKHKLIDNQVKADNCTSIFPSKELHLFNKKKECDNILHE